MLFRTCIVITTIICALIYCAEPVPYEHQVDPRKREYIPAQVLEKKRDEYCYKGGCEYGYYLILELNDGTIKDVKVTQDFHDSTSPYQFVELERNIADPKVINVENTRTDTIIIWFILTIVFVFLGVVKYTV